MQRREYKSARNERQSRWYAREQRRPLGLTKHWYHGDAEKDISSGKRRVLPATVADQQKQTLNYMHRLSPLRDMQRKRPKLAWRLRDFCASKL
jgi:hypothetical protein